MTRTRLRKVMVPILVLGALVITAIAFRHPLKAWFTGGSRSMTEPAVSAAPARPEPPQLPSQSLPPLALTAMQNALSAYDGVREALARDSLDAAISPAVAITDAFREAEQALVDGDPATVRALAQGTAAAKALTTASDLAVARSQFAELGRVLIAFADADVRLQTDLHVFACSMTDGFNRWIQRDTTIANPYQGQAMLSCGEASEWSGTHDHAVDDAAGDDDVSYYTCPMHPAVHKDAPGTCPICSMTLTPVTRAQETSGILRVPEARRALLGIRTGRVVRAPMNHVVTAVGRVTFDETRLHDVTLKVGGYIADLRASTTGQSVRKGETLFTLYSPELYAAQEEYLLALRSQETAAAAVGSASRSNGLLRAAEMKLRLWGFGKGELKALATRGEPAQNVRFPSPASGVVIEKRVVAGDAVQAGERLFRIADLDAIWVEAEVYEADLSRISKGQAATVTLTYLPGRRFDGTVAFVYPFLDPTTRTGRVRIALPNPELDLKPEMYATVGFQIPLGERLQIPSSAVVYTGPRRLVFLDLGNGQLRPQEVTVGVRSGEVVEILAGLKEGDVVVSSGNFLVAAESRIRSSAFWEDTDVAP